MSEYQYYEFQAIDRAITRKEMEFLRRFSTRATITPMSFVNEYRWGTSRVLGRERRALDEIQCRLGRRREDRSLRSRRDGVTGAPWYRDPSGQSRPQ